MNICVDVWLMGVWGVAVDRCGGAGGLGGLDESDGGWTVELKGCVAVESDLLEGVMSVLACVGKGYSVLRIHSIETKRREHD